MKKFKLIIPNRGADGSNIGRNFRLTVSGIKLRQMISFASEMVVSVRNTVNAIITKVLSFHKEDSKLSIDNNCSTTAEKKVLISENMPIGSDCHEFAEKKCSGSDEIRINGACGVMSNSSVMFWTDAELPVGEDANRCVVVGNIMDANTLSGKRLYINKTNMKRLVSNLSGEDDYDLAISIYNEDDSCAINMSFSISYNYFYAYVHSNDWEITDVLDFAGSAWIIDFNNDGSFESDEFIAIQLPSWDIDNCYGDAYGNIDALNEMAYSLCPIYGNTTITPLKKVSVFERNGTTWRYRPDITPDITPDGTQAFIEI